jgi:hypothetical protein
MNLARKPYEKPRLAKAGGLVLSTALLTVSDQTTQ